MPAPFALLTVIGVCRRAATEVGAGYAVEADGLFDELSAAIQTGAVPDDIAVRALDGARFLSARLACHPDLEPAVRTRMVVLYTELTGSA